MKRPDDFETRRAHLKDLDDQALYERFWDLAKQLTDPMLQMGRTHTSPSIERSVLMRMGFSSLEAKGIVEGCLNESLLGHGAGHVVLKMSRRWNKPLRETGLALLTGEHWQEARAAFVEESA